MRKKTQYIVVNEIYKTIYCGYPQKRAWKIITGSSGGIIAFESNYLENDHKAIVGKDVWDAVQRKISRNKELEAVVGHRGGQPHFLYGKVFCGSCGSPMVRRTVNGTVPAGRSVKSGSAGNASKGNRGRRNTRLRSCVKR